MARKTKICGSCNNSFDVQYKTPDGKSHNCSKRVYCYNCSPYGTKDKRHPKDRLKDLDGKRTCSICRERKPLNIDNFPASQYDAKGFRWMCRLCCSKRTIKQQKSVKIKCLEYKGNKCIICGYDKCKRALHFHHTNPNEKDFTLAKYRCRAWETMKAELDKCVLLCANCHAEVHDGITIIPSQQH